MGHWEIPRTATGVRHLLQAGRDKGVTAEVCLAGTGLTPARVDDPTTSVATWQEVEVATNLVAALQDTAGLGLALGRRLHVAGYGSVGIAMLASPTTRSALALARRFSGLLAVTSRTTVSAVRDGTALGFDGSRLPEQVRRLVLERDLIAVTTAMRELSGRPVRIARLTLPFPRDSSHDLLSAEIGIDPVYDAVSATVVFGDDELDIPLPQADPDVLHGALQDAESLLARRRAAQSVTSQVRERLWTEGQLLSLDQVAHALMTTSRTLRRRLGDEGTSYRVLSEGLRRSLATELLADRRLSIEQIAGRLGYADGATLSHAFKRWTGVSPTQFRGQAQGPVS